VIIDPTDRVSEIGTWRFDPDDERYAGWREEYDAFDRAHRARLVRFVARVADRARLAEAEQSPETVAQVALVKAALRWPEIAAMDNPQGWVYTVAANLVRKVLGCSLEKVTSLLRGGRTTLRHRLSSPAWAGGAIVPSVLAIVARELLDILRELGVPVPPVDTSVLAKAIYLLAAVISLLAQATVGYRAGRRIWKAGKHMVRRLRSRRRRGVVRSNPARQRARTTGRRRRRR
jgi:hypothetical protein